MVRETMASARSCLSLQSILKNGLESKPRTRVAEEPAITHPNIRHAKGFPLTKGGAPLARRADYFH